MLAWLLALLRPGYVRDEAIKLTDIVVAAVEQGMRGAAGEEKKEAALFALKAACAAFHLAVPEPLLDALIEATVGAMNRERPAPEPDPEPVGFHKAAALPPQPLC